MGKSIVSIHICQPNASHELTQCGKLQCVVDTRGRQWQWHRGSGRGGAGAVAVAQGRWHRGGGTGAVAQGQWQGQWQWHRGSGTGAGAVAVVVAQGQWHRGRGTRQGQPRPHSTFHCDVMDPRGSLLFSLPSFGPPHPPHCRPMRRTCLCRGMPRACTCFRRPPSRTAHSVTFSNGGRVQFRAGSIVSFAASVVMQVCTGLLQRCGVARPLRVCPGPV